MDLQAHARTRVALTGLSVGDAFGEQFFGAPQDVASRLERRELRPGPWRWTDDTAMALSVAQVLAERGTVDQDRLAALFADRYRSDPARGYGGGAHGLLGDISAGASWRVVAPAMFDGQGSHGNGAAMRVAPLGGFFAGDVERCAAEAAKSAAVTHAHPEAVAGAIAVAVAAAVAAHEGPAAHAHLIDSALAMTPPGAVRTGLERAGDLDVASGREAAAVLGSGAQVSAADTVPFVLWCAARWLGDFEAAMWGTVDGLGDRDTTCAMVGGIVALATGSVPAPFLASREPLPAPYA